MTDSDQRIVIRPRSGVEAERIARWLRMNFQQPGTSDDGPRGSKRVLVDGGNPLINADIKVVEL